MSAAEDKLIIEASPTKEFFISILVRDIALTDAINDLVDNCVDGARRIRPRGNFKGLEVRIEFSGKKFSISDNCGGIDIDTARHYAFRFGRDKDTPSIKNAIGQFGVGMKRALFKIGDKLEIESTTENAYFEIELNVDNWKRKEEWDFKFKAIKEKQRNSLDKCGTKITVTILNEGVASELGLAAFETKLRNLIQLSHAQSLSAGLAVCVQDISLISPHAVLRGSGDLTPVFREKQFFNDTNAPVTVRIYAGVSDSSPTDAGWYVSCNGRMVLLADQTNVTGWGEGKGSTIPKYHNQFARFRGYAFFDSKDGGKLPWNTMKTGVDTEHSVYQAVRLDMISVMRPIIDFLNKLDAEKDAEKKPLTEVVNQSALFRLDAIRRSAVFQYSIPKKKAGADEPTLRIIYYRPAKLVREVQKSLGVSTQVAVGEKTFDYYYKLECK